MLVFTVAAVILGATGCGSDEQNPIAANEDLQQAALELDGEAASGKKVWTKAGCGACHTLAASNAKGTVGPDFDEVQPSATFVVDRVALGRGVMPTYRGVLTPQEIADVAAYVAEASRR